MAHDFGIYNKRKKNYTFFFGYADGLMYRAFNEQKHDAIFSGDGGKEEKTKAETEKALAVAQPYKDVDYCLGAMERCMINPFGSPMKHPGWNNKMFVFPGLMPHHIEITSIKAELLQDISDEDCIAEGVIKWMDGYIVTGIMENRGKNNVCFNTPCDAFACLIDRICGKGTWESNPFVFAYEFKLVQRKEVWQSIE